MTVLSNSFKSCLFAQKHGGKWSEHIGNIQVKCELQKSSQQMVSVCIEILQSFLSDIFRLCVRVVLLHFFSFASVDSYVCCHYLFLTSPFDVSGRLCFKIVAFLGYRHIYFFTTFLIDWEYGCQWMVNHCYHVASRAFDYLWFRKSNRVKLIGRQFAFHS